MSAGEPTTLQGLVAQAMAWRVKYRVAQPNPSGRAGNYRFPIPIRSLGVHPHNRGGVYPSGIRCQSLCQEVLKTGFCKEEVNHAAVVVQEIPHEHIGTRGSDYVTGKAYNVKQCAEDPLFHTCFQPPYDDVGHMMLSHNHMLLILRAFLTAARWTFPPDQEGGSRIASPTASFQPPQPRRPRTGQNWQSCSTRESFARSFLGGWTRRSQRQRQPLARL